MAVKTAKDKIKVAVVEKAKALVEKRSAKLEAKQNEADLKLAKVVSLNTAQVEEHANLRVALEACGNKWYNEGFANAENSVEPVLGFEDGWLATLQALGVPEDSPFRDLSQIPFPSSTLAV